MSPTRSKTGPKSVEAVVQLNAFAKVAGGLVCDSSTGFAIGPGATVRSPDASWTSQPRLDALSDADYEGFWPISPDIVIEITSASDAFADTVAAVDRFMERGTIYGVAIDPATGSVTTRGTRPDALVLDVHAIIVAGERPRQ